MTFWTLCAGAGECSPIQTAYDKHCVFKACLPALLLSCWCCLAGQGYGSHNTGSTAENAKSHIPGTDANRESRYEQGRDTGRDSSYPGSGSNQGYGSGNQGYRGGSGSNTGRGAASYVPGTEANRESRAEHGQDPNRYTGSGSCNQGYGNNTSSGTQHSQSSCCAMAAAAVIIFL